MSPPIDPEMLKTTLMVSHDMALHKLIDWVMEIQNRTAQLEYEADEHWGTALYDRGEEQ